MKKIKVLIPIITILILSSCGPRRYKCGPYRRCEVKPVPELTKDFKKLNKEVDS